MKLFWKSKTLLIALSLTFMAGVRAQDIPDPMVPYRLVNDFAGLFSAAETASLDLKKD